MQVKPNTTWDNAPEEKKPVETKKEEPKKEEAMKSHKDVCAQGLCFSVPGVAALTMATFTLACDVFLKNNTENY